MYNYKMFTCWICIFYFVLINSAVLVNSQAPDPTPALPSEFPYHVSIQQWNMGQGRYVQHGSGIILDKNHVLTSTIVDGGPGPSQRYRVVAGITDLEDINGFGVQVRNLSDAIWHPDRCYENSELIQNNLEILVLAEPLILDSFVQPAVLPAPWHVPSGSGTITGWAKGLPSLNKLTMPILTYDECFTFFGKYRMKSGRICSAFLQENGTVYDSRYEIDRGHPILCHGDEGDFICGIHSFTTEAVEIMWQVFVGYPIVFTNIAFHLDWINATITGSMLK